ncbi:MAG: 2OG-Fe(II) oxygenase [Pseudomonadota bacterium]
MQDIEVDVTLVNGETHSTVLPANSQVLQDLHIALVVGSKAAVAQNDTLIQLPLNDGRAACSFMSSSVISVKTRPPVLLQPMGTGAALQTSPSPAQVTHVTIDDFLTPDENQQLLAYAIENEANFEGSTVTNEDEHPQDNKYRKSRVLFAVKDSPWHDLFLKRLKIHLPHVTEKLGRPGFTYEYNEFQLTASNDGDYFKRHADADHNVEGVANREITFVYYFHGEPKPYSGGDLLLYDSSHESSSAVASVPPANNSLVTFLSERVHEVDLVRCPSKAFSDSRFTINGWLCNKRA